jgi:hypothetical protein
MLTDRLLSSMAVFLYPNVNARRAFQAVDKAKSFVDGSFCNLLCTPLSAFDGQRTNLQPEKYFYGVHTAAKNVILLYFAVTGETLRGFVDSLKRPKGRFFMPFLVQPVRLRRGYNIGLSAVLIKPRRWTRQRPKKPNRYRR